MNSDISYLAWPSFCSLAPVFASLFKRRSSSLPWAFLFGAEQWGGSLVVCSRVSFDRGAKKTNQQDYEKSFKQQLGWSSEGLAKTPAPAGQVGAYWAFWQGASLGRAWGISSLPMLLGSGRGCVQ